MIYLQGFNESNSEQYFHEVEFMEWNKLIYGENFRDHYYQYNNIFLSSFANQYKSVVMRNWKVINDNELRYLSYKLEKQTIEIKNEQGSDTKSTTPEYSHHFFPYYKYRTNYQKRVKNTDDIIFNWNLTIIKTEDDWFAVKLIIPTTTNINLDINFISLDFGELDEVITRNRKRGRRLHAMYFKCDQIYGLRQLMDWLHEQIKIT
jgi:hypothetical protein